MKNQIYQLAKLTIKKSLFKDLPQEPGVYIFWSKNRAIYIGKSINLKSRLSSYFEDNLAPKTQRMVSESEKISFIKVNSELEALLLEAYLIKNNQPRYNSISKDDKHPLYIVITKEKYPRILPCRKLIADSYKLAWGPFPSSRNVYSVLKMLRKIFPYSDHKLGKKACIYSQIGLCNPCPSEIERIMNYELRIRQRKIYLKNIRYLKNVLSGQFSKVRQKLEKDMHLFSKLEKFEEAEVLKKQIEKLDYITQPATPINYFLENPNLREDLRNQELKKLRTTLKSYFVNLKSLRRIECYDVAHLAGTNPTASMVTFVDGEADKNLYRHFRIRQKKGRDDIASLTEVAKRRLKNLKAGGKPDLIIVDGGVGQTAAFSEIFEKVEIPVVGLAKQFETLIIPSQKFDTKFVQIRAKGSVLNLVQRIRNEAHRFARRYHHRLIKRSLLKIS